MGSQDWLKISGVTLAAASVLAVAAAIVNPAGQDSYQDAIMANALVAVAPPTYETTRAVSFQNFRSTFAGAYLSSLVAQRRHDWEKASQLTGELIARNPDDPTLLRRGMILAMGAGEYQKAQALSERLSKQEPDNMLALFLAVAEDFRSENYAAALNRLEKFPPGGLSDLLLPVMRSWAIAGTGVLDIEGLGNNSLQLMHAIMIADYLKDEKTTAALRLGLKIEENAQTIPAASNPKEGVALALAGMAQVLYLEQNDDSARIFAQLSLALNPGLDDAAFLLADIARRNKRYDDAISFYSAVNSGGKNYLEAQRQIAELMNERGQTQEAIDALEALADTHDDIESLIRIGDIQRGHEDYRAAIRSYDRAVARMNGEVTEEYWKIHYVRGMAYERTGQWDKAENDLLAALTFKPDHPYILNYLGYSWAEKNIKLDQALDMISRALALQPDDGYITDSLGWAYYQMGEYEKAMPYLERAVELLPYDSAINDHLGDLYWRMGRKLEARFQWQRARNHSEDATLLAAIDTKLEDGLPENTAVTVRQAAKALDGQSTE